jgi:hypothetical protein
VNHLHPAVIVAASVRIVVVHPDSLAID